MLEHAAARRPDRRIVALIHRIDAHVALAQMRGRHNFADFRRLVAKIPSIERSAARDRQLLQNLARQVVLRHEFLERHHLGFVLRQERFVRHPAIKTDSSQETVEGLTAIA
ncbi:hypothetical protein [Burkholderia sp. F1]|uniref:hypothetical protein n=1 Tax=Burkholderia sp. F1 TaxID=3366817 RepID=UPI003D72FC14